MLHKVQRTPAEDLELLYVGDCHACKTYVEYYGYELVTPPQSSFTPRDTFYDSLKCGECKKCKARVQMRLHAGQTLGRLARKYLTFKDLRKDASPEFSRFCLSLDEKTAKESAKVLRPEKVKELFRTLGYENWEELQCTKPTEQQQNV